MRFLAVIISAFMLTACQAADTSAPDVSAVSSAPADILPAGDATGVMPPKPPRPSLEDDAGYDIDDFNQGLGDYIGVMVGQDSVEAQNKIVDHFNLSQDNAPANTKVEQKFLPSGLTQIIVTREGLKDDSVKAEQFLAVIKPLTPKTGAVKAYGMRIKCYRGNNTDQWQSRPCP